MNRVDLLTRLTDAVIEGTLADDSLRDLAAAAGTSARMLIYHFKSRDELIGSVTAEIATRWRLIVTDASAEAETGDASVAITRLWHSVSARRNERVVRALMHIQGRAVSAADGLDESASPALPVLRAAIEGALQSAGEAPRGVRELSLLLTFAFWGAAEHIVLTRDRAGANDAVLSLVDRLFPAGAKR